MEMSRRNTLIWAAALPLIAAVGPRRARAHGYKRNAIEIVHPWTADQKEPDGTLVVLMTMKNTSAVEDQLLRAESKVSRQVVLRNGDEADASSGIAVPPRGSVDLQRAGLHLRIVDLNKRLQAYDTLPVTLVFKHAGRIAIDVLVEERS